MDLGPLDSFEAFLEILPALALLALPSLGVMALFATRIARTLARARALELAYLERVARWRAAERAAAARNAE